MVFQLSLTNTMTGKKQKFVPLHTDKVTLYVCGVTPYDFAHVGHGRCYVTFDLLLRLMTILGYHVAYCRNFTDIDDKLLNRAQKELGDAARYHEVATKYIDAYAEDMRNLNCLAPTVEPRVTDHIPEIIDFIQGLIESGHAYVVNGSVYYHVRSFPSYGKLSHRKLDDLKAGARVAVAEEKQDPLDFALWKSEQADTFWESPWGFGRPGWHIECSALARRYLGETIDIHGGGMDLIFPHHENEIAQTEGLFKKEFANCWVHNAFVQINKEKMSKSLGNFFTLRDIFARFDPMVVRFYFLQHQYRNPLDFSFDDLEVAQKNYQRLCKLFQDVVAPAGVDMSAPSAPLGINSASPRVPSLSLILSGVEGWSESERVINSMLTFLCDDLNTPGMFGVIFEHLQTIMQDKQLAQAVKAILQNILGLTMQPLPEKVVEITSEIQALLDAREEARKAKDWKRSDELRDQLRALGIEPQDKKV
jgi:cysteinyl-tRNA synthetase